MTTHEPNDRVWRERAAGYAMAALDADEGREFEAHLAQCATCRAEVAALGEVVGELGLVASAVSPRGAVWDRIASGLQLELRPAIQPWKQITERTPGRAVFDPGLMIVGSKDGKWEPTAVPGVRYRALFSDPANDRITMLVQMDAGARYPGHVHAAVEECYVLEGDLYIGEGEDVVMRAGDYQRADAGSHHPAQWTKSGCLLFIVSSLHDELDELTR
jgi:anti-sigma factor ChrR (cupin superfamily)